MRRLGRSPGIGDSRRRRDEPVAGGDNQAPARSPPADDGPPAVVRRTAMSGFSDDDRPESGRTGEFGVAAFTGRTTVHALLSEMGRQSDASVAIAFLPLDSQLVAVAAEVIARADVAVVDG